MKNKFAAGVMLICTSMLTQAASVEPPAWLARAGADAQRGYSVFVDKGCYLCHGYVGQGSPLSGPALAPGATYEYLLQFVRKPRNQMPPYFPEVLADADVRSIAAYLQKIPAEPKAQDLPLLRPAP
jgi:ubiquinol-cytochrome c reductase cytochrome c subunit